MWSLAVQTDPSRNDKWSSKVSLLPRGLFHKQISLNCIKFDKELNGVIITDRKTEWGDYRDIASN